MEVQEDDRFAQGSVLKINKSNRNIFEEDEEGGASMLRQSRDRSLTESGRLRKVVVHQDSERFSDG